MTPLIPRWLDDANLSVAEFRILCHLWRRAGKQGRCWPGVASIAKTCRLNEKTAWKALKKLEANKLLRREKRVRNSNEYHLAVPPKEGAAQTTESHQSEGCQSLHNEPCQSNRSEGYQSHHSGQCQSLHSERREGNPKDGSPTKVTQRRIPMYGGPTQTPILKPSFPTGGTEQRNTLGKETVSEEACKSAFELERQESSEFVRDHVVRAYLRRTGRHAPDSEDDFTGWLNSRDGKGAQIRAEVSEPDATETESEDADESHPETTDS